MRLSGLQKDVLSLYRSCLRESRKKPKVRPRIIFSTLACKPYEASSKANSIETK